MIGPMALAGDGLQRLNESSGDSDGCRSAIRYATRMRMPTNVLAPDPNGLIMRCAHHVWRLARRAIGPHLATIVDTIVTRPCRRRIRSAIDRGALRRYRHWHRSDGFRRPERAQAQLLTRTHRPAGRRAPCRSANQRILSSSSGQRRAPGSASREPDAHSVRGTWGPSGRTGTAQPQAIERATWSATAGSFEPEMTRQSEPRSVQAI